MANKTKPRKRKITVNPFVRWWIARGHDGEASRVNTKREAVAIAVQMEGDVLWIYDANNKREAAINLVEPAPGK